ncbi:MAG: MotA/TolQ/ExbB proton channel family protein [Myxococcales bacterium]|nr:MotA/TolQ/ExbB proton channel family protein [Myxococcales bacterium]
MDFNLVELVKHMSVPVILTNIFMIVMGLFALYIIFERYATFKKATTENVGYVHALRAALSSRNMDAALQQAQAHTKSPIARVMEGALKAVKSGQAAQAKYGPNDVGEFDVIDALNRTLDRIKERETLNLRKGLGGLGTVATITPFVGLFGTVLGIINAFGLLKGGGTIDTVGPAIAEALLSTAVGLLVAIIAAIYFNLYTTKVESIAVDMNDVSSEFVDFVLLEGRA